MTNSFSEINALHEPNPIDSFDLTDKQNPVNLRKEQQKYQNIVMVLRWLETRPPSPSSYQNSELMKHLKLFDRRENNNGFLYRKCYDYRGHNVIRQYIVPTHMRKVVLYRVHDKKYAGHCGIAKTATLFCQYFYFPNFVEFLTDYIKNCSSLLQVKHIKDATLKPRFLSLATNQYFPGDFLQFDLVGKLPDSAGFSFILTTKDVFSQYLFTVRCVMPVRQM